jgi:hypothetical protein
MRRQQGVTFVGMVLIGMLIVVVAIIGIRLVPAYIEYATIRSHLRELARSPDARGASQAEIMQLFDRRALIDNIRSVTGQDLDIVKDGDDLSLSAVWATKVKLLGNVSACIDFTARSD